MTRARVIAVVAAVALLAALGLWQHRREGRIADCESAGGVWNGARSQCELPAGRPIIGRDGLRRS